MAATVTVSSCSEGPVTVHTSAPLCEVSSPPQQAGPPWIRPIYTRPLNPPPRWPPPPCPPAPRVRSLSAPTSPSPRAEHEDQVPIAGGLLGPCAAGVLPSLRPRCPDLHRARHRHRGHQAILKLLNVEPCDSELIVVVTIFEIKEGRGSKLSRRERSRTKH